MSHHHWVKLAGELWVWVRIPLSALERAYTALKDRVGINHFLEKREEAHSDDAAAEAIKKTLRETHDDSDHS